jgi:hypothetical protein
MQITFHRDCLVQLTRLVAFNCQLVREEDAFTLGDTLFSGADQLVISLNTAKRHVKHLLAKLMVTNRTQAGVHARELYLK